MGLLDAILGGLNRSSQPSASSGLGGVASSPVVRALMLLLAAKAAQHYGSGRSSAPQEPGQGGGGGLGDLLQGGLGGMLGGAAGGGGIGDLLEQLRGRGFGQHVDSWVGKGQNHPMSPSDVESALGPDVLSELEQHTGARREDIADELARELPDAVDRVTPDGRLPVEDELASIFRNPRG